MPKLAVETPAFVLYKSLTEEVFTQLESCPPAARFSQYSLQKEIEYSITYEATTYTSKRKKYIFPSFEAIPFKNLSKHSWLFLKLNRIAKENGWFEVDTKLTLINNYMVFWTLDQPSRICWCLCVHTSNL